MLGEEFTSLGPPFDDAALKAVVQGPLFSRTGNGSTVNDFSDTPIGQTSDWQLHSNLCFNGGSAISEDSGELINYTDDSARVVGDPVPAQAGLVLPRWELVLQYGVPEPGSVAVGTADPFHLPVDDIHPRPAPLGRRQPGPRRLRNRHQHGF